MNPLFGDGRRTSSLAARYLVAGAWNTVFGYAVFAFLVVWLVSRVHYLLLGVFANVLAITNAYAVHKIFVFRTRGHYLREYMRYYVVYGTTAVCGLALLALLVDGCGLNLYLAQAGVVAVQVVVSFVWHRQFSFSTTSET